MFKNQIAAWIVDTLLGIVMYVIALLFAKTVKKLWTKFRTRNADLVEA